MKIDVRSVGGLQDLLTEGVENLFETAKPKRDHDWTRLTIMGVNCGNSLIRTQMKLTADEERSARRQEAVATA